MSEWWGPPWPGHGEGGRGGEHLPPRGGHLRCARQERRQEHRAPLQVLTLTVCQRQRQRHTESVLLTSQLKLQGEEAAVSKSEHQASLETTALATQVNHCATLPLRRNSFKYCYARENSFVTRVTLLENIVTPGREVGSGRSR